MKDESLSWLDWVGVALFGAALACVLFFNL